VTVRVLGDGVTLVGGKYNDYDIPVQNNSITFTVVAGVGFLVLSFLAPSDLTLSKSVEVVEDCGAGSTQRLFASESDTSFLSFQIIGNGGGPTSPEEGRPPKGRPK
jgi:hypothetical protein